MMIKKIFAFSALLAAFSFSMISLNNVDVRNKVEKKPEVIEEEENNDQTGDGVTLVNFTSEYQEEQM